MPQRDNWFVECNLFHGIFNQELLRCPEYQTYKPSLERCAGHAIKLTTAQPPPSESYQPCVVPGRFR